MQNVQLIQVGIGTVGGEVVAQVIANRAGWRQRLGLNVEIVAVVRGAGALCLRDGASLTDDMLTRTLADRRAGKDLDDMASKGDDRLAVLPLERIIAERGSGTTVILDAAAGDVTAEADAQAIDRGATVVLSNKAPLALPLDNPASARLWNEAESGGRLRYEATCGAGLPVISTLRPLLDTGDQVIEIQGALSGTLGAIFSDVAAGSSFSDAVRAAKERGYTEPDPRDDLSGLDVARKALILARTMGRRVDLSDVTIESLVPADLADCSVAEFLERISDLDAAMAERAQVATSAGEALKYIATVSASGPIKVGVQGVSTASVLGALQGPENIVSIRTERYDEYPLVVSGPGAGAAVTAAGMLGDVLALAR